MGLMLSRQPLPINTCKMFIKSGNFLCFFGEVKYKWSKKKKKKKKKKKNGKRKSNW